MTVEHALIPNQSVRQRCKGINQRFPRLVTMSQDQAKLPKALPTGTDVHVWKLIHDSLPIAADMPESKILNNHERQRQLRFITPELRNRFMYRREMIRRILTFYRPDIDASRWLFSYNSLGKPRIHPSQCKNDLYFNLSHTRGVTVLGIAAVDQFGIDIENTAVSEPGSYLDIAERFFTPLESAKIRKGPIEEQIQHFFDYWTLKEAYIKAIGKGLSQGLDQFQFLLRSGTEITIDFLPPAMDDSRKWLFHQETLDNATRMAIAIQPTSTHSVLGQRINRSCFNYLDCL